MRIKFNLNIHFLFYLDGPCILKFQRTADRIITYDSNPQHVATGDFNRDNHSDLVIANYAIDNIGIRLGDGNGSFTDQITYSTELDLVHIGFLLQILTVTLYLMLLLPIMVLII